MKLSICIATLNRAHFLGQTLDSLTRDLGRDTEVVIVDGASTDNTKEVVESFQKDLSNIRYVRLEKKGGVDQDYCKAVEYARGEFCWLMTDDDTVRPGAVSAVLDRLKPDVDLLVINAQIRNKDLTEVLQDRKMPFSEGMTLGPEDHERFFVRCADMLSFIGSVVIRRQVWQEREKERYFGSEFVHVGVIFQKPFERNVVVLAEPLILIRYGNAMWTERAFKIWMINWPTLLWSFEGISDRAKARVWKREPWNSLKQLLLAKARGHYTYAEYQRFLRDVPFRPLGRSLAYLIAVFPDRLYNFLLLCMSLLFLPSIKTLHLELRESRFYFRKPRYVCRP